MSTVSLLASEQKWDVQRALGDKLLHRKSCASVPGSHHPLAGPNLLCDRGTVDRALSDIKSESSIIAAEIAAKDINFGVVYNCVQAVYDNAAQTPDGQPVTTQLDGADRLTAEHLAAYYKRFGWSTVCVFDGNQPDTYVLYLA